MARPPSRRDRNRQKTKDATQKVIQFTALFTLAIGLLNLSIFKLDSQLVNDDEPTSWASLEEDSDPSLTFDPNPPPPQPPNTPTHRPVKMVSRTIAGTPLYIATIDLTAPQTYISVGLANNASQANSSKSSRGDEKFINLVRRHQAALTMSGTFFSMDAQKRVMGNLVSGGEFLKYSPWENYGTTLGVKSGNQLEMITARTDGKPKWQNHWFSLTAGPRLLRNGKVSIQPQREGFADPGVMGTAVRSAIGFPRNSKKLLHVTFIRPVSLTKEAEIMRSLGCWEAMNLDGGTSLALAKGNRILRGARRKLTNVITVYDSKHPAPTDLRQSWQAFQKSDRLAER